MNNWLKKETLKENISIAFSKTGSQIESHTIFFMTWIKNWKTQKLVNIKTGWEDY